MSWPPSFSLKSSDTGCSKTKVRYFCTFFDAKSAFDVVVRQNAILAAYNAGTKDQGLFYLDARMGNRQTFPQWGTTIMGPITDKLGLEQGAVNSDRLYKLCNNSQLQEAQDSGLGIDIGYWVSTCSCHWTRR